ncbi:MAG: hypothetical protein SynsKO_06690 [Synoicihabitans sp.]
MTFPKFHGQSCLVLTFALMLAASQPVFAAVIKSTPKLHTEATIKAGEAILHQATYYDREVIHLSEEIKVGEKGAYTLTPGYYLRSGGDDEWGYYVAAKGPGAGRVIKAPGVVTLQPAFQVSGDGKTIGVITNYYQAVRGKATGITRSTEPAVSTADIQKSLVYGGESGQRIKVGYREIWMSIQRPSEIQFVEYDLAESPIIESHGARIEVLKAKDGTLRYRVLKSFD